MYCVHVGTFLGGSWGWFILGGVVIVMRVLVYNMRRHRGGLCDGAGESGSGSE